MSSVLDVLSWVLFVLGSGLVLTGAIGVFRFPDFYTRLHAAGVTDTFGADLVLLAMALQAGNLLVAVKLLLIFIFLLLTSPVSTHAIAHAAWARGLPPKISDDLHFADESEPDQFPSEGQRS